jgi:hypothetical protein
MSISSFSSQCASVSPSFKGTHTLKHLSVANEQSKQIAVSALRDRLSSQVAGNKGLATLREDEPGRFVLTLQSTFGPVKLTQEVTEENGYLGETLSVTGGKQTVESLDAIFSRDLTAIVETLNTQAKNRPPVKATYTFTA